MSDDLRDRFDHLIAGFNRLSQLAQFRDRKREIDALGSRTCGHCFWWMKSGLCPKERNERGYSVGPSSRSPACSKFQREEWVTKLQAKRAEELDADMRAAGL